MDTAPEKYAQLVADQIIPPGLLNQLVQESARTKALIEDLLLAAGVPRQELLRALSGLYRIPFIEYDEGLLADTDVLALVDLEQLKKELWLPLRRKAGGALVIVCNPSDLALCEDIKQSLQVDHLQLLIALPAERMK